MPAVPTRGRELPPPLLGQGGHGMRALFAVQDVLLTCWWCHGEYTHHQYRGMDGGSLQ